MFCMDDKNIDDFCKQDFDDLNVLDIYEACFENLKKDKYESQIKQLKAKLTVDIKFSKNGNQRLRF